MTYVIKRDGSKVKWDSNKIVNAVRKAFESCKEENKFNKDEFKEFAKQYATTKGEYDSRLKSTKELYKGVKDANVENEVTADIVGDYLFTDTDFINNLYTEIPNIFKILNEEIKLTNDVTIPLSKKRKDEVMKEYLSYSRNNNSMII